MHSLFIPYWRVVFERGRASCARLCLFGSFFRIGARGVRESFIYASVMPGMDLPKRIAAALNWRPGRSRQGRGCGLRARGSELGSEITIGGSANGDRFQRKIGKGF